MNPNPIPPILSMESAPAPASPFARLPETADQSEKRGIGVTEEEGQAGPDYRLDAAASLLEQARAAGLRLSVGQGKVMVSGKRPPAELLAALREHKAALVVLLDSPKLQRESEVARRQRWSCVPGEEIPLVTSRDVLPREHQATLAAYVGRMDPAVGVWLARRAGEYRLVHANWSDRECMITAAVDLVLWQQPRNIPTPEDHLRGQAVGRFLEIHADTRP